MEFEQWWDLNGAEIRKESTPDSFPMVNGLKLWHGRTWYASRAAAVDELRRLSQDTPEPAEEYMGPVAESMLAPSICDHCGHPTNTHPRTTCWGEPHNTITDGYGSTWSKQCPICKQLSMEIVRPGKAQCNNCGIAY